MKQAVVIVHGMGEQVPMDTVRGFVKTVWRTDENLVSRKRPDPNTGQGRDSNAAWTKPDDRMRTFEIRRITTEEGDNGYRTDFFEFYWAHLVHGTTWEQVQAWIADLLLRNPLKCVPPGVLSAWIALWLISLAVVGG